jgi:iron complex outermembrane receptor protein
MNCFGYVPPRQTEERLQWAHGVFLILLAILSTPGLCGEPAAALQNPPAQPAGWDLEALATIATPTVSAASKGPQPVTQAPSSVTIITASELKRYGYRTLADGLQSVRSLYVSYDHN